MKFNRDILKIDSAAESENIVYWLRHNVNKVLSRRGVVVGTSGGVDSSVALALAVRAFGAENVIAVMMPEQDSESESEQLARQLACHYGVEPVLEAITPALTGFGCYARRDTVIKKLFPEYNPEDGYTAKITLPGNLLNQDSLNIFSLVIISPDGEEKHKRLSVGDYLQVVAASNFKQRARMSMLYYHAELRNYAVVGTANKNEHDQGFFVKFGDGGVDLKPIAHLYKTQIYELAKYLDVPEEILNRPPTTDTYSAHQSQEEFFFRLPFEVMDLLWYAQEYKVPISEVAEVMNLTETQILRAYDEFSRKHQTTEYLRTAPLGFDHKTENSRDVVAETSTLDTTASSAYNHTPAQTTVNTSNGSVSLVRSLFQRVLHKIAFVAPGGSTIRPWLHRLRGVQIGQNVWISQYVYIDELHPEAVVIGDNCSIGLRSTIFAHSYWGPKRSIEHAEKVIIEDDVFIGPHCVVLPNVHIGRGAVIKAGTTVTAHVPENTFWGLPSAGPLARVSVPLTPQHSFEEFRSGLRPLRKKKNRVENEKQDFSA